MKNIAIALTLLVGLVGTVNAAGDAENGKAKSVTCMACHGTDGNATITIYPKLAGQHADYIVKQLKDFKSGARNNPIMAGMSAALSEQDMLDLGAYFQSQQVTDGTTPKDVVTIAKNLYQGGDMERNIPACIACHGPRGNGSGLAKFPKIASQNADYIAAQLKQFRSGERANDPSGMMGDAAKKLTDVEIVALSKYLGGLH
jgi:cytochrome c553